MPSKHKVAGSIPVEATERRYMGFNPSWKDFWDFFEQLDPAQQNSMKSDLNIVIAQASKGVKEEILECAPPMFHSTDAGEMSSTMRYLLKRQEPPMSESERKKVDQLLARAKEREKNTSSRYVRNEQRYVMRRGMYSIFRSLFGGRF